MTLKLLLLVVVVVVLLLQFLFPHSACSVQYKANQYTKLPATVLHVQDVILPISNKFHKTMDSSKR